ncbi:hypothetical protein, partial [Burkholderia sp. SIMBA_024]|uniref:hypothetical protein n=1 Tax=Burkholderia sp. SIMBA_024 TaxID=3085768 RepID=UPI00397DA2DE
MSEADYEQWIRELAEMNQRAVDTIIRHKAEIERLEKLLVMVANSIDDYAEPDPEDTTRGWNSEFGAYHRGLVLFSG